MVRTRGKRGGTAVLPLSAVQFLRRRMSEAVGAVLIVAAAVFLVALVSYVPSDPSLNSATEGRAQNLLGVPGAYVADFFLQFFGMAAALPGLIVAVWGGRMIRKRALVLPWMRVSMLGAAVFLLAMALDTVPEAESWPLMTGMGGVAGAFLLDRLAAFAESLGAGVNPVWAGVFCAVSAAAASLAASGVTWAEWRAAARRLAALVSTLRRAAAMVRPAIAAKPAAAAAEGGAITRKRPAKPRKPVDAGRVEPRPMKVKPGKREGKERQGKLDLEPSAEFQLPSLDLLDGPAPGDKSKTPSQGRLEENAHFLESVLADFGVSGKIVTVRPGPVVTLYEFEPAPGVKTARVIGLSDDIARSMSAVSVRAAVVRGRNVIGIELPNAKREMVHLRELLASDAFERASGQLMLSMGKDIGGTPVMVDLARMPHLLVAGTTGSGKSVAINAMILTLLYQLSPAECRLILIDPKMLELIVYQDIPHLLCPVVTEAPKAVVALKWVVREMEERYRAMSHLGVRNIAGYNTRLETARKNDETLSRRVQTGFDAESGKPVFEEQPLSMQPLPFIVVVVDEMADLMLVAGKDVEASVQRLAQMARAAGIHLIMATQRPSVDVITGTIKANFPYRVSFQVTSKIDSRTILGEQGAEQLLGEGDLLFMSGGGRITRVHGPFVSDSEVERVVSALKSQGEPDYIGDVTEEEDDIGPFPGSSGQGSGDPLYDEAVAVVTREGKASTSFVQRHLQIGYNRAARIVERMESEGIVSKADRVGRREVIFGGGA